MSDPSRRYGLIALVFLVLCGVLIAYLIRPASSNVQPQTDKPVEASNKIAGQRDVAPISEGDSALNTQGSGTEIDVGEYLCSAGDQVCLSDPLGAKNESEALWLKQFGYPSSARLQQLERMPLLELQALSEKGDLAARTLLGKKRIDEEKDYAQGRIDLMSALVDGGTYAAYELARSNRTDVPNSARLAAKSYYRLAYLLGDWKSSREMYGAYPEPDGLEDILADKDAMHLYRNVLKERARRRLSVRLWPRP